MDNQCQTRASEAVPTSFDSRENVRLIVLLSAAFVGSEGRTVGRPSACTAGPETGN